MPTLIEPGDAAATAQNILDSEFLFRIGIVSNLLCQLAFIWLVLALYRLFKDVNKDHARLMVSLVLVSIPISIPESAESDGGAAAAEGYRFSDHVFAGTAAVNGDDVSQVRGIRDHHRRRSSGGCGCSRSAG